MSIIFEEFEVTLVTTCNDRKDVGVRQNCSFRIPSCPRCVRQTVHFLLFYFRKFLIISLLPLGYSFRIKANPNKTLSLCSFSLSYHSVPKWTHLNKLCFSNKKVIVALLILRPKPLLSKTKLLILLNQKCNS
jgi:hypothetical protein